MSKPLVLIFAGAMIGVFGGLVHIGGEAGLRQAGAVMEEVSGVVRAVKNEVVRGSAPIDPPARQDAMFTSCLTRSGPDFERSLKNLLAFHEHEATLDLVECLLRADPMTFCEAEGAQQAADAMEIYLWSRDDTRHTSPAHDLADKIHMLDRSGPERKLDDDPFVITWSGPRDKALFERIKNLVRQGYLDPGALSQSGRAELREAVRGLPPAPQRCVRTAAP